MWYYCYIRWAFVHYAAHIFGFKFKRSVKVSLIDRIAFTPINKDLVVSMSIPAAPKKQFTLHNVSTEKNLPSLYTSATSSLPNFNAAVPISAPSPPTIFT